MCESACVDVDGCRCALVHMWRSEGNFGKSVLSLHRGIRGSNLGHRALCSKLLPDGPFHQLTFGESLEVKSASTCHHIQRATAVLESYQICRVAQTCSPSTGGRSKFKVGLVCTLSSRTARTTSSHYVSKRQTRTKQEIFSLLI